MSSAITRADKEGDYRHSTHTGLVGCAVRGSIAFERFLAKPHLGSSYPGFRGVAAVMVTWLAPVPEAQQ